MIINVEGKKFNLCEIFRAKSTKFPKLFVSFTLGEDTFVRKRKEK